MQDSKERVTLGVQEGGPTSHDIIAPHVMALRRALASRFPDWESVQGIEVGFVLRVDGDISFWNRIGPDYLRLYKKRKEINLDLFMPRSAWEGASGAQIEEFLKGITLKGFEMIIARLKKEKLLSDEVEYRRRVREALNEAFSRSAPRE